MYFLAQLHSASPEKSLDLIQCIDYQQKLSCNYDDGYEVPINTIIKNEYLELCNNKCEYLDLSTHLVNMVDNRDSVPEDNLYCNMNPELIG